MIFLKVELYHNGFTTIHPNYNERACLVWALMSQAVLWGIKNGRRATKILMNDFFSIPLHLAKIFFVQVAHLVIF